MAGKLYIEVLAHKVPGVQLALGGATAATGPLDTRTALLRLAQLFTGLAANTPRGMVRVRADDSTGVAATDTFVVGTYTSLVAGDYVIIKPVGSHPIKLTVITTGTQAYGDGTFKAVTSNTVTGDNLVSAINSHPTCIRLGITASNSSGTVTVTFAENGSWGNTVRLTAFVTGGLTVGSALATGGKDAGKLTSVTLTLSDVIVADETLVIGGVTLTGKASPSGENQFACGVTAAADGAALVACINAHSKLKGILLASGTSAPVIQLRVAGRIGNIIAISETTTNGSLSASSFAPATTEAYATAMVEYDMGGTPA